MLHDADRDIDSVLDRQRELWLSGRRPSPAELLGDDCETDREVLLDVLYNEILLREELGWDPSLAEYLQRYPELSDELRLHFEVHDAIHSRLLLDTVVPSGKLSLPGAAVPAAGGSSVQDDYEILGKVGQGGMAVVYRARHRKLRRNVALKMISVGRRLTSRELARFRTEAEAMARLAHPNIIQIFEIGENQGEPYLALELADGGTLVARFQAVPYAPDAAAELIETLARAVHHAHERQVIHRDLKPANVLFTSEGIPKISDFGLAKFLTDTEPPAVDVTLTGETIGTPRYMAPEQVDGAHDQVRPATDVYALGTLLYECLAGRAPFYASSVADTFQKIRHDDPLPLRRFQNSVPRDLETICLHCLHKEPGRRYATAQELADDLRRFLRREPIQIRPIRTRERLWRQWKKRPAKMTLLASAVMVLLALPAATFVAAHRESRRILELRQNVASLMDAGRAALDREEYERAQARFQAAWRIVQAEPSLSDHQTSVAGWLDHARNAIHRYHWKQRIPPRDFDDRRDEALLLSLLIAPHVPRPVQCAREAIHSALELTVPDDAAWQAERDQLVLLDSLLLERESGAAAATAELDESSPADSRQFHERRAELLAALQFPEAAAQEREIANRFPARTSDVGFREGMDQLRNHQYDSALKSFELVLRDEPEHFTARLFQAICFLRLHRPAEAKIALTACIAQRRQFCWSYIFRAQAQTALGEWEFAHDDLETARSGRLSDAALRTVLLASGLLECQRGRGREALDLFAELARRLPEDLDGRFFLRAAESLLNTASRQSSTIHSNRDWNASDFPDVTDPSSATTLLSDLSEVIRRIEAICHWLIRGQPGGTSVEHPT